MISLGKIAWLLLVWTFALLLGLTVGLNVPFILLIAYTILYLLT